MLNPYDVANYFFELDPDREYFNQNLISKNGAKFYEGNARLNKYMHMAQNIYLAMTGELLIDTCFYAYANGAVIPSIQKDYSLLSAKAKKAQNIPDEKKIFLKKIFYAFKNADIDEIIEIDHEDSAWLEKCENKEFESQKMDSLAHVEEYKKQYADMVKILERMEVPC